MDLSVTAMASACLHFGTTHPPCQKTAVLVRVISTALGELFSDQTYQNLVVNIICEWLLSFPHAVHQVYCRARLQMRRGLPRDSKTV